MHVLMKTAEPDVQSVVIDGAFQYPVIGGYVRAHHRHRDALLLAKFFDAKATPEDEAALMKLPEPGKLPEDIQVHRYLKAPEIVESAVVDGVQYNVPATRIIEPHPKHVAALLALKFTPVAEAEPVVEDEKLEEMTRPAPKPQPPQMTTFKAR
jgi:hypothetical protein